uniref:CG-1 domain-containing protein n=1 Tax=Brassica oleracea var. oleracea TaxID=109376 RepID=A0A0D3D8N3_BRAOL
MCSEILGKMSTKKDGKTVKEAHEKLKIRIRPLRISGFLDRIRIESGSRIKVSGPGYRELMHIVFVQYLEVKGNRISSNGIKENNSNSLSGSTSVNVDSTANTSSTLSPLCEDADSGNQDGWIHRNRVKEIDSKD